MFWLIVPAAIGVSAAVTYFINSVSESEKAARQRWHAQHAQVQRTIEEHRRNIEQRIHEAQTSYEFHFLVDMHYSSMRVADTAYGLRKDSKQVVEATQKMMHGVRAAIGRKTEALAKIPGHDRAPAVLELNQLREFLEQLRGDYTTVRLQDDSLRDELQKFNSQTRVLKEAIRDRCGTKGREWYENLETRKRLRNAASR